MIPWVHLDTAQVPGGGELKLMQRGTEFSIMIGRITLMNSKMSSSEIALAQIACERVGSRRKVRILIGGYGMGFTLRAALAGLGPDAQVTVAELVPQVIDWAKGPMAALTAGGLTDPRVSIHDGDVRGAIAAARASYDAILLDVDNGPDGFSRGVNDGLYDVPGLEAARRALRPSSLLSIWSASPDPHFAARGMRAGFKMEEIKSRANNGRGNHHIIWVGTTPGKN